jgi:hypothetical protein
VKTGGVEKDAQGLFRVDGAKYFAYLENCKDSGDKEADLIVDNSAPTVADVEMASDPIVSQNSDLPFFCLGVRSDFCINRKWFLPSQKQRQSRL